MCCPRPDPAVVWQEMEGQVLIVHAGRGEATALDPVAGAIWRRLDGRTAWPDLVHPLAVQFSGDPAQIARDLEEFLEDMLARGLLEPAPGAAP